MNAQKLSVSAGPGAATTRNRILDATGAVVVVSSTWRMSSTVPALQRTLEQSGFTGTVVDCTPVFPMDDRGTEIGTWIQWHHRDGGDRIESFVILDDDSDMGDLLEWLVQTKNAVGLTGQDAAAAVAVLGDPVRWEEWE